MSYVCGTAGLHSWALGARRSLIHSSKDSWDASHRMQDWVHARSISLPLSLPLSALSPTHTYHGYMCPHTIGRYQITCKAAHGYWLGLYHTCVAPHACIAGRWELVARWYTLARTRGMLRITCKTECVYALSLSLSLSLSPLSPHTHISWLYVLSCVCNSEPSLNAQAVGVKILAPLKHASHHM